MMASESAKVAEIGNNLDAVISNLQKAGKMDIIGAGDLQRMKAMEKLSKDVSKTLVEGGAKNYRLMTQNLEAISHRIGGLQKEQMKYLTIYDKAVKSGNENMIKLAEKRLKLANKQMEARQKEIELEQKNYTYEYQKLKDLKKELEFAGSNMQGTMFDPDLNFRNIDKVAEYAEGQFDHVAGAFGDAMSGSLDNVASRGIGITRGISKRLRIAGQQIEARDEKSGGHSKLGGMITKLGKGLAVFGGIAAGLFAVAKAMQAVEEAQKGANKELLDSVGGTDLMVSGTNNLYDAVNTLRKSLSDGSFANSMGMSLDEVRGLVGELHSVDITMRSLQGNTYALKDIMKDFQGNAKMLGVSFADVADYSNNFRMELGYAAQDASFLERMADQFNTIRDLALQSGYNTNKFFQTVKKLTDGVDNMNYRVGQAGKLFLNLSKVLGPKAAEAFAEGLAGGFKGEGVVDRYKRIILTGGKKSKKIIKSVAESAAANFKKTFQGSGEDDFSKEKEILQKYGINVEGDKRSIVQALASKSDKERQMIMGELQTTGGKGQGMSRQLMGMFDLAKGSKGGLSNMAMALGQMDMMGSMQMQMAQVNAFLGDKGFAGASATQLEALSQYTGKSMEELENMRQIAFMMRGQFMELEKIRQGTGDDATKKAELEKKGFKGLTVKDGKILTDTGEEITNLNEYMASQGSVMEDMKMDTTTQNQLLRDQTDATLTSAQMINNHLGGIMQNATDVLGQMLRHQTKDDDIAQYQQQYIAETQAQITEQKKLLEKETSKGKKELNELISSKEGVKDANALREINSKIKEKRSQIEGGSSQRKQTLARLRARKRGLSGSSGYAMLESLQKQGGGDVSNFDEKGLDNVSKEDLIKKYGYSPEEANQMVARRALRKAGGTLKGQITTKEQADKVLKDYEQQDGHLSRAGGKGAESERIRKATSSWGPGGATQYSDVMSSVGSALRGAGVERKREGAFNRSGGTSSLVAEDGTVISRSKSKGRNTGVLQTKELKTEDAKQKELREGNAQKIADEISTLKDKMTNETDEKKKEKIRQEMFAKNKKLKDFYADAAVLAQRKIARERGEGVVKNILGQDTKLDSKNRRDQAMKKLQRQLADPSLDDQGRTRIQTAMDALGANEVFYSTDSRSASTSNKPMLFRRGTLTVGQPYDQVDMYDPRGGGGSGGGASPVINIYGGDEKRVFDVVKRAMKAQSNTMMG